MITTELKAQANKIVNDNAGTPTEITRLLKRHKMRYVVVRKGGAVRYIVRSNDNKFKTIITL